MGFILAWMAFVSAPMASVSARNLAIIYFGLVFALAFISASISIIFAHPFS
jgi:hypothetical protein